jgi:hypothetical protein
VRENDSLDQGRVDGEMEATNVADGLIMEVNERDEQG